MATGAAGEVKGGRGGSRHAEAADSDGDGSKGGSGGCREGGATGAAVAAGWPPQEPNTVAATAGRR